MVAIPVMTLETMHWMAKDLPKYRKDMTTEELAVIIKERWPRAFVPRTRR